MPDRPERRRALFIQDHVDVNRAFGLVVESCRSEAEWLTPLADAATKRGEELLVGIGPAWALGLLSCGVRVRRGGCHTRGDSLVVPIEWEAEQIPRAFPVFAGEIEVTPLQHGVCRLILSGSYAVPLGEFGRRLDSLVLHRVAESTVRSFLGHLAAALEESGEPALLPPTRTDLGDLRPGLA